MANFYAVKSGRETGIFDTWPECQEQIKGYSGAIYKKFKNHDEALIFLGEKPKEPEDMTFHNFQDKKNERINEEIAEEDILYAYVDGSFNAVDNISGYGLVLVRNDEVIIKDLGSSRDEEANESRNIVGELHGAIKAIELAIANDFPSITICYDYMGIELWATEEWRAKKKLTQDYQNYMIKNMKNIDVKFKKIKAHSGEKYNEEADRLAKIGAEIA